ncbi:efflux RND transporter periplasmic adaptor subunit [Aquirhabdus sp.]|uniref:efflux RND transporter periplasmic adaptor subunit n=1 Tax=Aquirhabdus sp. TaxID=2824160 RepID=UPI00396CD5EF
MNTKLVQMTRYAITTIVVVIALVILYLLWQHYKVQPWTRDGRIRANVVQIAPDVSGLVTKVLVRDNQEVKAGDVLFVIDHERYRLAVDQAKASLESARTQLDQAEREVKRNVSLRDLVSAEQSEQSISKRDQLRALIAQDMTALESAELNLSRTDIRASVNGRVTNLELRPGTYATAGKAVLALIDLQSIYVIGYFEETKIDHIQVGDEVHVRLMGWNKVLKGHVDSIAGGIEDRELGASSNLLANVNPTFNWVRLAQRIPVRILLDEVPESTQLILGRTASVEVIPRDKSTESKPVQTTTTNTTQVVPTSEVKPVQGAS